MTRPNVSQDTVTSIAGSIFSIDCNFSVTPNLVGNLNVQWLNSSDSLVSENNRLMLPHLLTSHGGEYTCKVTVSIPLLKITLVGNGTTTVIVQSMSSLSHLIFHSFLLPIFFYMCPFFKMLVYFSVLFLCCKYSLAVPAPLVIIEEIGTPFDGSEFTISCIVKVNKSVDTDINIYTHWLLPMRQNYRKTMFNISERVTELVGRHSLTFKPLRSQDSGQYVCNATTTPQNRDFYVAENTAENSYNLAVQSEKQEYIETLLILCLY